MSKRMTKKQKKQVSRFVSKNFWLVMLLIVIIVAFLFFAYYKGWLDKFFKKDDDTSSVGGNALIINFLDVGQGDCIIIQLPDGKNMIIDSGSAKVSTAKPAIENFTNEKGITSFDYLLLTHADEDHVGNMSWVIDNFTIGHIFRPNNNTTYAKTQVDISVIPESFNPATLSQNEVSTETYARFMLSVYNKFASGETTVEIFNKDSDFSGKIKCDDKEISYSFDFLTPVAEKNEITYSNRNDYSPYVKLSYASKSIMFTGDGEAKMMQEYVDNYGNANNIDVLKVGHHGSENATSTNLLNVIDPEYAIIQCGLGNSYKHPHKQVLDRLTEYDKDMKVYRNDTNGLITLTIESNGLMTFNLEHTDCSLNLVEGESMPTTLNVSFDKYISNRKLLVA